jgi:diketogulonate reductase-like aldo/keto reductase
LKYLNRFKRSNLETIKSIADKYNVHPAAILLHYTIDTNTICVVKSANPQRIKEKFNLVNENKFKLNEEDFKKIDNETKIRFRYYKMPDAKGAKLHPFNDWKDYIP